MFWILLAIAGSSRTAADDQVALERMARGEHDALAELYDRHGRLIYSLALRILRDQGDAEDIVQDVFSQAWRQAARFDVTRGNVVAWLVTMTRTRAIDVLRRRKVRPELVHTKMPIDVADGSAGQDVRVEWQHRAREIRRALGTLPHLQRIAIELAYFDGLSHSEIAEQLEVPLGTIKTRVRQGLLKIRDCLAGAGA
ncbi:MAG: sigma-70 family RNA polymerase sigma factor [Vicinamibacterales bacterium]